MVRTAMLSIATSKAVLVGCGDCHRDAHSIDRFRAAFDLAQNVEVTRSDSGGVKTQGTPPVR